MNYRLNVYGISVDLVAKSLSSDMLGDLDLALETSGQDLVQIRMDFFEDRQIDPYQGDLLQISGALNNDELNFILVDELDNLVVEFSGNDLSYLEVWDRDENPYPYTDLFPNSDRNIYFSSDQWRGGVISLVFESDEIPTPKDFCLSYFEVETPDEDWSLVNKYYFRGKELEISDHLDSFGRGSYAKIYRSIEILHQRNP